MPSILAANALTTVATMEAELGIPAGTQTTLLERLINEASDAIEHYCSRTFYRATLTEKYAGHGTRRLMVDRTPLESITSITVDGSLISPVDYSIEDAKIGTVYRELGWLWTAKSALDQDSSRVRPATDDKLVGTEERYIEVVYIGGYVLPSGTVGTGQTRLPWDLERVAMDTVTQLFRNRGKYQNLQTETEMLEDATWRGHAIPGPARKLLDRYRRVS